MCEIETRIDRGADFTVRTVTGEVTAPEILAAMASYYAGGPTRLVLWDFSGAALERLSGREVRSLAEATGSYVAGRVAGRTALVFSSTLAYGLGRMFDQARNAGHSPVDYASFRDRGEAMAWLGVAA